MPFVFNDDIDAQWNRAKPEWSYMVNGASLAMPYLEPYLIRTMKKALPKLKDPALIQEVKDYIGQEAQHYQQHRKFNDLIKSKGYQELNALEEQMLKEYSALEKHQSLRFNLAYAAGFESMALAVGHWLIKHRESLFGGSDPHVASLILWHFVEEIEHKCAAYDAYQAAYGSYWHRVYGTFFAALHVMKFSRRGYIIMMKKDGGWRKIGQRLNIIKYNLCFLFGTAPKLLHSLLPWHHPSDIKDPQWSVDWIHAHKNNSENLAYLDTNNLINPIV
ncbi:metal-dependent hydrolase [Zhongshania aliphaticivorans]|nr:metal-dependent hydrolase [Zhongshania aliphaticivorans]